MGGGTRPSGASSRTWQHPPHGIAFVSMKETRLGWGVSQNLASEFQKAAKTRWCEAELEFIRGGPERPLYEAVKVNSPGYWWHQHRVGEGDGGSFPHGVECREQLCVLWTAALEHKATQTFWSTDSSIIAPRCLMWSCRISCFPYWVSVSLWLSLFPFGRGLARNESESNLFLFYKSTVKRFPWVSEETRTLDF